MFYKVLFIWLILATCNLQAQSIRSKVNKGNQLYQQEKYEEALVQYKDALLDDPLHEISIFNEADASYKLKKYDQALASYQKLLGSKDMHLVAKAHYNIGNIHFQQNKLQEAIKSYKSALEITPDDRDIKHNLELARAKLKENAKKQKQNPQQQQNQKQQNQQKQDQQKQNQQKQEDQQKDKEQKKEQEKKKQKEQEAQEQQEKEQKDPQKMDKQEAERILKALNEDEKNNQKKKAPIRARRRYTEKDW